MKIALNSYSLRNEWKDLGNDKIGTIIKLCKDLGITEVELLDSEVNDDTIVADVKRLSDNGINVFALAPHVKILDKPDKIDQQIKDGTYWITLANKIGAKKVRFQVGDGPFMRAFPPMDDFDEEEWEEYNGSMEEAAEYSGKIVNPLLKVAEEMDVIIGLETHHSFSSNYIYMKYFNEKYNSKYIGWVFDIGNYENDSMRWKGLEAIKNRMVHIHAKSYKYDENGLEVTLDFPKACKILKEVGFDGEWSIEFEGKYNGIVGVYQTTELVKYSIAKSEGKDYKINTDIPNGETLINKYKI